MRNVGAADWIFIVTILRVPTADFLLPYMYLVQYIAFSTSLHLMLLASLPVNENIGLRVAVVFLLFLYLTSTTFVRL